MVRDRDLRQLPSGFLNKGLDLRLRSYRRSAKSKPYWLNKGLDLRLRSYRRSAKSKPYWLNKGLDLRLRSYRRSAKSKPYWLWRLYLRNGWLDIGRKRPVPHESWFQVAGYFYYYGHYYAAMSMDLLPAGEQAPYQAMLAELMLARQEANGAWWDYPLYDYHEAYGTSYALMTLLRCLPNSSTHE